VMVKNFIHKKAILLSEPYHKQKAIDSLSYEAIILNIPEPSTLQFNRLYTFEFFAMCKKLLSKQGIVTMSLMSTADYVGNDALKVQSTMYQTIKAVFKNVLVIPGEKNYFLASDGSLTAAVATLGTKQGIENEYVNEYFLDDASLQERSATIMKRISAAAPLNLDFEPVGCYRQLHYWLSYKGNFNFYLLVIPLILLLFVAGMRSSGTTVALFSAGLSSFSLEIILILTFQVIYGYVYLATGIFITLFMAGLAPGVFLAKRYSQKSTYKSLVLLQVLSVCIILLSLACISIFNHWDIPTVLVHGIFSVLIFGMAMITGAQFHIASVLKSGNIQQVAASSYSADMLGSAAGALLVNALIVTSFGFITSLYVVVGVSIFGIILLLIKKQA
jgi:spermidine synthase